MNEKALRVKSKLWHGLIPAVPVPFRGDGTLDEDAQSRYAAWMSTQPIAGVAVWAHTGRGLLLSKSDRERVLTSWRDALPGKIVIAGVGGDPKLQSDMTYLKSATEMALDAKRLGADAVLCYAPTRYRGESNREQKMLAYHNAIASAGLPMILFFLYDAAGGISYMIDELESLMSIPDVLGIKIATLDSVMTYQRVAAFLATRFPEHLLITGEDRFLGYSLMMGANAALIGMAAARTELQNATLDSYWKKDFEEFFPLATKVDRLAKATFIAPMEGYIARMLYVLAEDGIIPHTATFDPWGPTISGDEKRVIRETLQLLA